MYPVSLLKYRIQVNIFIEPEICFSDRCASIGAVIILVCCSIEYRLKRIVRPTDKCQLCIRSCYILSSYIKCCISVSGCCNLLLGQDNSTLGILIEVDVVCSTVERTDVIVCHFCSL